MTARPTRFSLAAVWTAWLVAAALAGGAALLGWRPTVGDWWLNLPLALGYPLAGAIILTSRPGHPIGRLMVGAGLAAGLAVATHQYATRAIVLEPGSLPYGTVAAWLGSWLWVLGVMPVMSLLPLLFPDGHLVSKRWRPVLVAAVAAVVSAAVGFGLAPGRLGDFPSVHNPVGVTALSPVTDALQALFFPLMLVATAGSVASLVVRWRRADQRVRRQIHQVVGSLIVFVTVVVAAGALPLPLAVSSSIQMAAALLVPAAIVFGVLRRQLFDVAVVLRPTLVYLALAGSVLAVYVAGVQLVGRLAGDVVGLVVATGLVAMACQPLHARLQRGVDRLFHGDRDNPVAAATRLGEHVAAASSPRALLDAVAAGVGEALRAPGVRVTAIDGDRVVGAATWGRFETGAEEWPVCFYGRAVGNLEVARRELGVALRRADHRALGRLAPHVGTAMHITLLTADLTTAREQAVLGREEERRRIRRDLHDGLGPVLAGLGLGLEGAADLVADHPEQARSLLAQLTATVHTTTDEVRRLVYELRPPSLDDLGLLGALRECTNSVGRGSESAGNVMITIDAPAELPPLPAAVEVAIYRIATEALTNVRRHAHANRCTVRLQIDDGIELTVEDDGVGVNSHAPGVGLSSMRERVRELSGIWSLEACQPTGTRIRVRLPLEAA